MSALITRASISSVTPGSVAIRAPASLARLRAAVCESDCTVGASTTSAAAIASATVARRLAGVGRALGHHRQHRVGAGLRPPRRASRSPSAWVAGLQTTSTSSPSLTPRQSLTTARTACSRSPAMAEPYWGPGAPHTAGYDLPRPPE